MNRVVLSVGRWWTACLMMVGAASVDARAATVLLDTVAATTSDVETVSGDRWLACSFTTDSASYASLTATLPLAESTAGVAQLDLYDDGGLQPGDFFGAFAPPASYAASLTETDFTLTGLTLAADTSYWLVLHASSGAYDWAWTSDSAVTSDWGESDDAGASWFTGDAYPLKCRVVGDVVPEPAAAAMAGAALLMAVRFVRRGRK